MENSLKQGLADDEVSVQMPICYTENEKPEKNGIVNKGFQENTAL